MCQEAGQTRGKLCAPVVANPCTFGVCVWPGTLPQWQVVCTRGGKPVHLWGMRAANQAARAVLALPSRKEQVPLLTRLGVTPRHARGKRPSPLWTTCHMSQRQATLIQQQEALKTAARCDRQRRAHGASRDARALSVCRLSMPANVAVPSKPRLPSQAARSGGRPARFAGRPHRGRAPGIACMNSSGFHVRVDAVDTSSGTTAHPQGGKCMAKGTRHASKT